MFVLSIKNLTLNFINIQKIFAKQPHNMTVSEFLQQRNETIVERYKQLKREGVASAEAKKTISLEFNKLSVHTIDQIIYNKDYSNSPYKK